MIRFEDVPPEAKEPVKKAGKADPKPVAEVMPAADGGLPLGDEPAAAPAKKAKAGRKPRKT